MHPTTAPAMGADLTASASHDLCVFIGRFQPFHAAHLKVVETALQHGRFVLVLIGSAGAPRSHRNPFTYNADMIRLSVNEQQRERLTILPLEDCTYNDTQWVANAQKQVNAALAQTGLERRGAATIGLIGHGRDHTSYYLKLFPQWGTPIDVPEYCNGLSSTRIRNSYFSNLANSFLGDADGHKPGDLPQDHLLPTPVRDFLTSFAQTEAFRDIREEYEFILQYRAQWAVPKVPYPVTFVTVDACVVTAGSVLLVRRKGRPGKGLWALPGGFLDQTETVMEGMLRELREETKIAVPPGMLRGSIVTQRVFDEPNRSSRGRTITHGFLIHLTNETALPGLRSRKPKADLPRIEAADDAEKAQWWPLADIKREMMFEDHYDIILALTALI
jgi:bifunctional NMN adenylyltransferase/nudix hydrolase